METDIDDVFNADDSWDATGHTNSLTATVSATTSDITSATTWAAQNNFRIDNAYNSGGSNQALLSAFTANNP